MAIIDKETEELLYTLVNMACPFGEGWPDSRKLIQVAYLASHDLLTTTYAYSYVHLWKRTPDGFEMVLRLNTEGYMEFTADCGKLVKLTASAASDKLLASKIATRTSS